MLAYVGRNQNLKDLKDLNDLKDPLDSLSARCGYPFLDTRREPSALEGWILEGFHCGQRGSRAFLRILSTEGRGVGLCWAKSKPNGPKRPSPLEDHALDSRREPSALGGWIHEVC